MKTKLGRESAAAGAEASPVADGPGTSGGATIEARVAMRIAGMNTI
jgi:hypothetical protein